MAKRIRKAAPPAKRKEGGELDGRPRSDPLRLRPSRGIASAPRRPRSAAPLRDAFAALGVPSLRPAASSAASASSGPRRAGLSAAARKIQRAYLSYRAQFPRGGRLRSASSSPRIYQDDERIAGELSRRFAAGLTRLSRLAPEGRDDEIGAALQARRLRRAPGMLRAVHVPASGRMAFTGGSAGAWAVRGYEAARQVVPQVADLTGPQVDYALLLVQMDDAPQLAQKAAGRGGGAATLLRTIARRKSVSPRHGGKVRELAWAAPEDEVVVGAPGDRFSLPRDMRAFLGHALGGFRRYRWQMNPRRRSRVAMPRGFRAKRWIMHSNLGVGPKALYAWLREMHGWRDRMAARRNWASIYPRPLVLAGTSAAATAAALAPTLRDLLRRHIFGLRHTTKPAALAATHVAAGRLRLSAYARAVERKEEPPRRDEGVRSSSVGPYLGLSRTRPRRLPARQLSAAGIVGDGRHAGVFMLLCRAAAGGGCVLQMAVLDPLGAMTFPLDMRGELQRGLERAVRELRLDGSGDGGDPGTRVVGVQVGLLPVPQRLAVQYASEGSCGPSSVALLMSVLRALPRPGSAAAVSPGQVALRAFRLVTDEDVVLAAQLHHNSVL